MPQNNFMELFKKRYGERFDTEELKRKKDAREPHEKSHKAQALRGIKAKMYNKQQFKEKIQMKKMIKANEEKMIDVKVDRPEEGAVPTYLLDRENMNQTKILSNMVKQKRKEKAGKWAVPVQKVKQLSEAEMFQVVRSGKRMRKQWKRKITKATFVGGNFTRKPPKYERYIRPSGMRFKKAHVTHPELKTTFFLEILGVKKNPQSALYTNLGVLTKGTVIEVNISDLGLVTQGGKIIWSKYAQVTNHPENDGCINAILLV